MSIEGRIAFTYDADTNRRPDAAKIKPSKDNLTNADVMHSEF
jgi:hypothetical protein